MEFNYLSFLIPLTTGGVMGAFLNHFFALRKDRIQPVGYQLDIIPLFKKDIVKSAFITNVTISDGDKQYNFDNLFVINILITNKGNKDIDDFKFSVKLSEGDKIISVEHMQFDRYRNVAITDKIPSPVKPLDEVEMVLDKFNRKDSYHIRLHTFIPEGRAEPGKIKFNTPQPVKFTSTPTIDEVTIRLGSLAFDVVANEISTVRFGGIKIYSKTR